MLFVLRVNQVDYPLKIVLRVPRPLGKSGKKVLNKFLPSHIVISADKSIAQRLASMASIDEALHGFGDKDHDRYPIEEA